MSEQETIVEVNIDSIPWNMYKTRHFELIRTTHPVQFHNLSIKLTDPDKFLKYIAYIVNVYAELGLIGSTDDAESQYLIERTANLINSSISLNGFVYVLRELVYRKDKIQIKVKYAMLELIIDAFSISASVTNGHVLKVVFRLITNIIWIVARALLIEQAKCVSMFRDVIDEYLSSDYGCHRLKEMGELGKILTRTPELEEASIQFYIAYCIAYSKYPSLTEDTYKGMRALITAATMFQETVQKDMIIDLLAKHSEYCKNACETTQYNSIYSFSMCELLEISHLDENNEYHDVVRNVRYAKRLRNLSMNDQILVKNYLISMKDPLWYTLFVISCTYKCHVKTQLRCFEVLTSTYAPGAYDSKYDPSECCKLMDIIEKTSIYELHKVSLDLHAAKTLDLNSRVIISMANGLYSTCFIPSEFAATDTLTLHSSLTEIVKDHGLNIATLVVQEFKTLTRNHKVVHVHVRNRMLNITSTWIKRRIRKNLLFKCIRAMNDLVVESRMFRVGYNKPTPAQERIMYMIQDAGPLILDKTSRTYKLISTMLSVDIHDNMLTLDLITDFIDKWPNKAESVVSAIGKLQMPAECHHMLIKATFDNMSNNSMTCIIDSAMRTLTKCIPYIKNSDSPFLIHICEMLLNDKHGMLPPIVEMFMSIYIYTVPLFNSLCALVMRFGVDQVVYIVNMLKKYTISDNIGKLVDLCEHLCYNDLTIDELMNIVSAYVNFLVTPHSKSIYCIFKREMYNKENVPSNPDSEHYNFKNLQIHVIDIIKNLPVCKLKNLCKHSSIVSDVSLIGRAVAVELISEDRIADLYLFDEIKQVTSVHNARHIMEEFTRTIAHVPATIAPTKSIVMLSLTSSDFLCPICLSNPEFKITSSEQCGHKFHLICISKWFASQLDTAPVQLSCPVCRQLVRV